MIFPTILHTRAAVTEVNGGYEGGSMQIAITVLIATLEYARFLLALLSPDSSPICPADHAGNFKCNRAGRRLCLTI